MRRTIAFCLLILSTPATTIEAVRAPYIPDSGDDFIIPGVDEDDIPCHVRMGGARGPEQFHRKAEEAVAGGAAVLKIIASGAVAAGRFGDMIAVRGDPLANINSLHEVDTVIKGGLVFKLGRQNTN